MERSELLDKMFFSSTSKVLREEQLLNLFGVASLDDIPTEKLLKFCNAHYCFGGGKHGSKI